MTLELFSALDGKAITVNSFAIDNNDGALEVRLQCVAEDGKSYLVNFENVSVLNIKSVSSPFQICGFEILDYAERGFQKDSHYFIHDYEDGALSFYYKAFKVYAV